MILTIIFMLVFSMNASLCNYIVLANDIGGWMFVHVFGSAFGLAAAYIYSNKRNCKNNPNIFGSYSTIVLTLLATLLLWILFPVYNWLVGTGSSYYRLFALMSTIYGLCAWAVASIGFSYLLNRGKLYP